VGEVAPAETVSHALYPVASHLKTALLSEMLRATGPGSVLVFTRTKHRAKRIAQQLQKAGFPATALQGNLSQNQRQAALDGFRSGNFRIMVATDIAARGIDVLSISHVINYDMPDTTDAYTHRIGRTGRAERSGEAFTLVTPEDNEAIRAVERVLGRRLERRTLAGFNYQAAAPTQDHEFAREPRPSSRPKAFAPQIAEPRNTRTAARSAPPALTSGRASYAAASGQTRTSAASPAVSSRAAAPAPRPESAGRQVNRRAR